MQGAHQTTQLQLSPPVTIPVSKGIKQVDTISMTAFLKIVIQDIGKENRVNINREQLIPKSYSSLKPLISYRQYWLS